MNSRPGRRVALLLLLLSFFLSACYQARPSAADKDLMLKVTDFKVFEDFILPENHPEYENFQRTVYFDSSIDLDYEYEVEDDMLLQSSIVYLSSTFSFERKRSDAKVNDMIQGGVSESIFKASGLELRKRNDVFRYGDSSRLYELASDGETVGNYFQTVKGDRYFSLYLVGFYIDDPVSWQVLLGEKLERMEGVQLGFFSLDHGD